MLSQAIRIMVSGPAEATMSGSATRGLSGITLRIVVVAWFALACLSLNAQPGGGTVNFANSSSTLVFNGQTGNPVTANDGILAALYWAPLGSSNFVQIGDPVIVGSLLPGRFAGSTRATEPETPGGSNAWFQVRAWGGFSTYEQALANNGALIGQSATFQMRTGNPVGVLPVFPPTPPASLLAGGLSSFTVTNHFILFPPGITANPTNQSVAQGQPALFSVTVIGTAPFAYQWFKNQTNLIDGATAAALSLTNVQGADAGGYSVVVTNAYGSATSSVATLTVYFFPPVIRQQPQNRAAVVGGSAQFSVISTGSPPLTFQWQHTGTNLVGRTSPPLNRVNLQASDFGEYRVVVSNPGGSTTSSPAQLTPAVRPQLAEPELNLSTVYLSFPTELGPLYEVEYKITLDDSNWQSLATLSGTGGNLSVTDNNVTNATRFYRVRVR